jgi:hypothetical protein
LIYVNQIDLTATISLKASVPHAPSPPRVISTRTSGGYPMLMKPAGISTSAVMM